MALYEKKPETYHFVKTETDDTAAEVKQKLTQEAPNWSWEVYDMQQSWPGAPKAFRVINSSSGGTVVGAVTAGNYLALVPSPPGTPGPYWTIGDYPDPDAMGYRPAT